MAHAERDSPKDIPISEDELPHARRNLFASRSDRPLFTSLHNREKITFARRSRGDGDENERPGLGSGNGRGWMGGTGIRLTETFERIDADGNYIPRSTVRATALSSSRIPRTKSFSPPGASPSPSSGVKQVRIIQGRDKRSASAPADSENESTGPLEGSPSPGARGGRLWREGSEIDISQVSLLEHPRRYVANDQDRARVLRSYDEPPLLLRPGAGPRVQETTRTLVRKTSESSLDNEPPLRPPKSWGWKAKKNSDWMAKILDPEAPLEPIGRPDVRQHLDGQRAVADIPLPSVEDISAIQTLTPPASRPASAHPKIGSPEKSHMWDADLDFTAQSMQISTSPQLRVKPTKLDGIRSREIQSLTARAVATNRLEEIREKVSEERSPGPDIVQIGLVDPAPKAILQEESENEVGTLEQDGYQIQGTQKALNDIARTNGTRTSHNEERGGNASLSGDRDETWETLRALSRVLSSKRPSPPRQEEKEENKPLEVTKTSREGKVEGRTTSTRRDLTSRRNAAEAYSDTKRHSGTSTPPKSDVDPEERITAEARLFELPDTKSERNSIRAPSRSPSPSGDDKLDETPRPRADPLYFPTPKVTGAFIETPAPSTRKPRKSRPPRYDTAVIHDAPLIPDRKDTGMSTSEASGAVGNVQRRRRVSQTKPRPVINSSKTTSASEDLRRIQQEAQLDDSTLENFDAILEAHAKATAESGDAPADLAPILDLEYDERGQPLSAKEIARRAEILTLDRMCQAIKNTSTSIRDAKHGIERLEHQVSSAPVPVSTAEKGDATAYIMVPVPRLTIPSPNPRRGWLSRNWKFTWLGFILAASLAWFVSEVLVCQEFCHSNQSMNPKRSHYSDPYFPLAIPTKLDQWTGNIASGLFWDVWDAMGGERPSLFTKPKPCPWWLGRDGPVGIVMDETYYNDLSFFSDEAV